MERDACNDLRDASKRTGKIGVREGGVGGLAIAHLGNNDAHSSYKVDEWASGRAIFPVMREKTDRLMLQIVQVVQCGFIER
jgi:hypothetical protein